MTTLGWQELVSIWIILNIVTYAIYGLDKYKAKRGRWRISERKLLLLAFLGGAVGAYAGMKIFRHKTLHPQFRYGIPVCIALQGLLLCYLYFG